MSIIEEVDKLSSGIENIYKESVSTQDIYPNLLLDFSKNEEVNAACSVKVINNTCEIYKYYKDDTTNAVQAHFTRSLQHKETYNMNSKATQSDLPVTKTGRPRRRTKKQQVTLAPPIVNPNLTTAFALNHPYTRPTQPRATFFVPARMDMLRRVQPPPYIHHHHHPPSHHLGYHYNNMRPLCHQHATMEHGFNRIEHNVNNNGGKQPVYKAFCDGKTLIEVYSPTVGNGFNPRYNSQLIEPIIKSHLPHITGQSKIMPPTPADIQAFLHIALEFNPPYTHDVRLYGN